MSIGHAMKGWLQLLRLPNLPTVPGDPLAGFILAACGSGVCIDPVRAAYPVLASLFLYMAGLIANDCADFDTDRHERPDRPIPSGAVSLRAARLAWSTLAALGILAAAAAGARVAALALVLLGVTVCYNFAAKHIPVLGPLTMGLCRALSVALGAVAAGWQPALLDPATVAMTGIGAYVAAVTTIAADEVRPGPLDLRRWLPCLAVIAAMEAQALLPAPIPRFFPLLAIMAIVWALLAGIQLGRAPDSRCVMTAVGRLLRGLLLMQAAFCALQTPAGLVAAVAILCLWPVSMLLSKWFYAT